MVTAAPQRWGAQSHVSRPGYKSVPGLSQWWSRQALVESACFIKTCRRCRARGQGWPSAGALCCLQPSAPQLGGSVAHPEQVRHQCRHPRDSGGGGQTRTHKSGCPVMGEGHSGRGRAGSCYCRQTDTEKAQPCLDKRSQQPLGPEPSSKWACGRALNTGPALNFTLQSSFFGQQLAKEGSAKVSVQFREGPLLPVNICKDCHQPTRLRRQMGKQSPEGRDDLVQAPNSVVWRL